MSCTSDEIKGKQAGPAAPGIGFEWLQKMENYIKVEKEGNMKLCM